LQDQENNINLNDLSFFKNQFGYIDIIIIKKPDQSIYNSKILDFNLDDLSKFIKPQGSLVLSDVMINILLLYKIDLKTEHGLVSYYDLITSGEVNYKDCFVSFIFLFVSLGLILEFSYFYILDQDVKPSIMIDFNKANRSLYNATECPLESNFWKYTDNRSFPELLACTEKYIKNGLCQPIYLDDLVPCDADSAQRACKKKFPFKYINPDVYQLCKKLVDNKIVQRNKLVAVNKIFDYIFSAMLLSVFLFFGSLVYVAKLNSKLKNTYTNENNFYLSELLNGFLGISGVSNCIGQLSFYGLKSIRKSFKNIISYCELGSEHFEFCNDLIVVIDKNISQNIDKPALNYSDKNCYSFIFNDKTNLNCLDVSFEKKLSESKKDTLDSSFIEQGECQ